MHTHFLFRLISKLESRIFVNFKEMKAGDVTVSFHCDLSLIHKPWRTVLGWDYGVPPCWPTASNDTCCPCEVGSMQCALCWAPCSASSKPMQDFFFLSFFLFFQFCEWFRCFDTRIHQLSNKQKDFQIKLTTFVQVIEKQEITVALQKAAVCVYSDFLFNDSNYSINIHCITCYSHLYYNTPKSLELRHELQQPRLWRGAVRNSDLSGTKKYQLSSEFWRWRSPSCA